MLTIIPQLIIGATDLAAAFLFMYGLKRMSSPVTAPSGIFVAGIGMLVAVLASFLYVFDVERGRQAASAGQCRPRRRRARVGGGVAWWSGKKGRDDGHAADGGALQRHGRRRRRRDRRGRAVRQQGAGRTQLVVTLLGALIGAVSLSGSLIAWAKLDGVIKKPLRVKGQQVFNGAVMLATLAVGGYIVFVAQRAPIPADAARI
jgi:H+-translocating NAD(P) transhydrogenase subunit beta